jgi:hypothetical protein
VRRPFLPSCRFIIKNGVSVHFSNREFRLLAFLMSSLPGSASEDEFCAKNLPRPNIAAHCQVRTRRSASLLPGSAIAILLTGSGAH